jgi:hypothetical protein
MPPGPGSWLAEFLHRLGGAELALVTIGPCDGPVRQRYPDPEAGS